MNLYRVDSVICPSSMPVTSAISRTFLLRSRSLPRWTIRSIPLASCPLTAEIGRSIPIRIMVSSLASMSRALFACPVDIDPS